MNEKDTLIHYGTKRHSGRYPWGSGEHPYQSEDEPAPETSRDWLERVSILRKEGLSETDISKRFGLSTAELRAYKAIAKKERRDEDILSAEQLRGEGKTNAEIAKILGYPSESSIRSLLSNEKAKENSNVVIKKADELRKRVDDKGIVDIGEGSELYLGISKEKMKQVVSVLEAEGYKVYGRSVPQVTNYKQVIPLKLLCKPGTAYRDVYHEDIYPIVDFEPDKEAQNKLYSKPVNVDINRVKIRYSEEGGGEKDGLIELRPGCRDLCLGGKKYAQVRILVDGDRYLKGMAMYGDENDFSDGVDIIFNTNKNKNVPARDVMKPIKSEETRPFGATIKKQYTYFDDSGKECKSPVNIVAEENDWNDWSVSLPSQFLSKQNYRLVKQQCDLSIADKKAEFDDILSVEQPTVRRFLFDDFANRCDKQAATLKTVGLPRQKYQVLIPENTLKDNECYAPNYISGEKVALVRFPHAGTFEIPILTVNNNNRQSKKDISNGEDAIGINAKVASILSGADFDGDTVIVLPLKNARIKSSPELEQLKSFDPKSEYKKGETTKTITDRQRQTEMGKITNLITDMTLKGASEDELARAVKHSMVVIDAEKHELDYKRSETENGISKLKIKYQGGARAGSSTLVSKSKRKMRTVDNAEELLSDEPHEVETEFCNYANSLKDMAKEARLKSSESKLNVTKKSNSESEKEIIKSINDLISFSKLNSPKERISNVESNTAFYSKYPKEQRKTMSTKEIQKLRQIELDKKRINNGASNKRPILSENQWKAIESDLISDTKTYYLLNKVDRTDIYDRFLKRKSSVLSDSKVNKIKMMKNADFTNDEIAKSLNVSVSTVQKYTDI